MHSTILIFHIAAMILSLVLMTGATAALFANTSIAAKLARGGVVATVTGVGAGFALLLSSPLGIECLALSAYLAAVMVAYRYAFGMGVASRCLQLTR
jgi:hypothetical protein